MEQPATIDDARRLAHSWAIEKGKDPRKFLTFAEDCIRNFAGITESQLLVNLRYFDSERGTAEEFWLGHGKDQWRLHEAWTIETVKHLAFVNAGSIAGAATLLTTNEKNHILVLKWGLVLFIIGMITAVLDLWLNSMGHFKRGKYAEERRAAMRDATTWTQLRDGHKYQDRGKWWFAAAESIGWLSAACWVAGAVAVGMRLLG